MTFTLSITIDVIETILNKHTYNFNVSFFNVFVVSINVIMSFFLIQLNL